MERNVGLVGAGYWGKNLARNFDTLGALHTICDLDAGLLQGHQERYPSIKTTSDFQHLLDNPAITRIAIAAPAKDHFEMARSAIQAGKDVYVEKPLCLSVEEGEELTDLARREKRILMVGHILQYHPCVQKLHELVRSGELGQLQYISSNRLNLGKICFHENALWSYAPHDVSVILLLTGSMPTQVRTTGGTYLSQDVADLTMTTLDFPENLRGHIYVSWLSPFKEQKLTVIGSHGMAVFDDTQPWSDKLLLYRDYLEWSDEGRPAPNPQGKPEHVEVPEGEPLREECQHFLDCCESCCTPRTDGMEGLRVLRVLQAAQASLLENGESKDPRQRHKISLGKPDHYVHPTATVDPGAHLSNGCQVWHGAHVMPGASLGEGCKLGQNVFVGRGVQLGRNVKVQNNVSLYQGVTCEEDVFLGPSCVLTNVINPRSAVVRQDEYRETLLRRGCTVGANATIVCGQELGEHSFVGAGAVVTKDVKPYALVVGNPAQQIGWMSRHGHRLDIPLELPPGESLETTCPVTGERYLLSGETLTLIPEEEPALTTS